MARCESIDVMSQLDSNDAELLIIESSDSESENDFTSNSNQGVNEEEDCNSDSPENTIDETSQVNVGPVLSLQCLHEDDDEDENIPDDPDITSVKIVSVSGLESGISQPQSSIPARNSWEGAHNFRIKVQCSDCPRKSESTIFSEEDQKLYVAKDHPFKILVFAENVPSGSRIKVTAVFALAEHSYEVVQRCPTHAQADFSKGNPVYEHFVQCFSSLSSSVYTKNPDNGKLSVSVPYEKPQEGEQFTTYLFKLTCFSSCSGGINRRPFMLVFSLEKDNIPLGRQAIEAKVCACPVRDYKLDQNRDHKKKSKTDSSSIKFSSDGGTVNSKYTISVKDPELYIFLKQMKCLYEMTAYSSKINPDT